MKSRIVSALLTVAAVIWLTTAFNGQAAPAPMFNVNVPFDFVAGGTNLPAGLYTVRHMMNSNWILLSSSDGRTVSVVQVLEASVPIGKSDTKLVFNRYAEKYFLSQVWTANDHQVHHCVKSGTERELASRTQTSIQVAVMER